MRPTRRDVAGGALAALVAASVSVPLAAAPSGARGHWLGSWGTALQRDPKPETLPGGTRVGRTIVSSLAGSRVRVRLSNEHGEEPLAVADVRVDSRAATFSGAPGIVIPPYSAVLTDPVTRPTRAGDAIELSAALPGGGKLSGVQRGADKKAAWAENGGDRRDALPALFTTLDVESDGARPVLAILSDTKSADPATWVNDLVKSAGGRFGIVNRSVFGGLLALGAPGASALARFDRDVLATAGVSHVLIFAGNNDLIQPGMIGSSGKAAIDPAQMQTAAQLTALLDQAVRRTRGAGLVALGATWLPYEGVTIAQGYSTPEKLQLRDDVNRWIRRPGSFDGLMDFDAALRDPTHPSRLIAAFDSGNHFTPNDAGYRKMAEVAATVMKTARPH